MRPVTCICILLAMIGCSSQPAQPPAASTAGETARIETDAARDDALAKAAKGYKVVRRNGKDFYCRDQTPLGSHVARTTCLTQEQLRASVAAEQDARDALQAPRPSVCSGTKPNCSK